MQCCCGTLSWIKILELHGTDFQQLMKDQAASIEISAFQTAISGFTGRHSSARYYIQDIHLNDTDMLCYVSLGKQRPVVPKNGFSKCFQQFTSFLMLARFLLNELWMIALFRRCEEKYSTMVQGASQLPIIYKLIDMSDLR